MSKKEIIEYISDVFKSIVIVLGFIIGALNMFRLLGFVLCTPGFNIKELLIFLFIDTQCGIWVVAWIYILIKIIQFLRNN